MFQQDRNRCHSNVGSVIAAEARRHEFSSVAIFLSMLLIAVMLQGKFLAVWPDHISFL